MLQASYNEARGQPCDIDRAAARSFVSLQVHIRRPRLAAVIYLKFDTQFD